MDIITGLEIGRYKLGVLCKKNHRHDGRNQSVRMVRSNGRLADCVCCNKERSAAFYKENRIDQLNSQKEYIEKNKSRISQRRKERYEQIKHSESPEQKEKRLKKGREYHQRNKEKEREYAKEWYKNNPEKSREKHKRYRDSHKEQDRERMRRNSLIRKARKKSVFTIPIDAVVFREKLLFFSNKCAYCLIDLVDSVNLSWDHVIPISKGGTHTPGNLVPCCLKCNSSKSDSDIVEWFSSRSFFSEKQLCYLLSNTGKTRRNYNQLTLL